jgi:hypothetical protein
MMNPVFSKIFFRKFVPEHFPPSQPVPTPEPVKPSKSF